MNYTTLPNTELKVSKICLGTMTFGNQNTEIEAHSQLDYAIEKELILSIQLKCIHWWQRSNLWKHRALHRTWIKKIEAEREKLVLSYQNCWTKSRDGIHSSAIRFFQEKAFTKR